MAYHRPTTLKDALALRAETGAAILAGGTDVYPALARGNLAGPTLDLTAVQELRVIDKTDDDIRIGAAATWSDIIKADLPDAFCALKQAARQIGSLQIQNSATVAGNLCNASPAADGIPALLVLDARVEISSAKRGERSVPLAQFVTGVRQTDLQNDEIVTAVHIPPHSAHSLSAFEKLGNRAYLVISIAMVAALVELDGDGCIAQARIAVGACSPVAQRLRQLESDCVGKRPANVEITDAHLSPLSPIDDIRGTASYRREAVAELCSRALIKAARL